MELTKKEVMRYLGYRGAEADERTDSHIAEMIDLFTANVIPKSVYGIWDCQVDTSGVTLGGMTVRSRDLARHLEGCRRAALLAATLGAEADMLIRRFSVQDMEKALVAQAVCAAMIEAYCDTLEFPCPCPTARFSPGYGDFDIAHQKDILNMLQCSRIGLTLTEGYMMIPSKSVTAVVGFAPKETKMTGKCAHCDYAQCDFREAV